jgi:RNA polymerase primary sigma factor/RNA polymerase sporulation-specific sigma factor
MKRDPMTNEQLCALAKQGNADAQNQLIENNLPFVQRTAYEIWSSQSELNGALQIDTDDLILRNAVTSQIVTVQVKQR